MKMKNIALATFALVLLLAACKMKEQPQKNESAPSVSQIEKDLYDIWVLDSLAGVAVNQKTFATGAPTLELRPAENKVTGFSGCNNFHGEMTSEEKNKIKFSALGRTKRFCQHVRESEFFNALEKVNRYERTGLFLHLKNNEKTLLIFKKVD